MNHLSSVFALFSLVAFTNGSETSLSAGPSTTQPYNVASARCEAPRAGASVSKVWLLQDKLMLDSVASEDAVTQCLRRDSYRFAGAPVAGGRFIEHASVQPLSARRICYLKDGREHALPSPLDEVETVTSAVISDERAAVSGRSSNATVVATGDGNFKVAVDGVAMCSSGTLKLELTP